MNSEQATVEEASPTGEMAIMGREGDTRYTWNRRNEAETEAAHQHFKRLRKQGFIAFRMKGLRGTKGEQMQEFDATAGKIIFVPPFTGG